MKHIFPILIYCFVTCNLLYAQETKQAEKNVTIYFIRPVFNHASRNVNLYHQNEYIGKLRATGYLKYECSPGCQLFWGAAENQYFIELNAKAGETYVIKADLTECMLRPKIKLTLVNKMDEQYDRLLAGIAGKKPHQEPLDKIKKNNACQKFFIDKSLLNYKNQCKLVTSSPRQPVANQDLISSKSIVEIRKSPIILDYNFIDLPFSKESISLSGFNGLFTNPSMSQSLNIASSFYSATREGLYRLMSKSEKTRKLYKLAFFITDWYSFYPIPLADCWLHEEFHRAVFAKNGGDSYNDVYKFPFSKDLINVSHVKDDDLVSLKKNHPADMVRMAEAGIEGEYLLAGKINKTAFFNNSKSITIAPLLSTINSIYYVSTCSTQEADDDTDELNTEEGDNVEKRDLLGLDFTAWVYDLYRPDEPYTNRGIHPSGVGINRYIKRLQLTHDELSFLKLQGKLQLINLINPFLFFENSFTLQKKENGDDTRANFYFNHWLSPFGYDISTSGLLHYNRHNYAFTFHNYANHNRWFPGIEFETWDYLLGEGKFKRPIPVSAKAMLWLQPKNQSFFSENGAIGGFIETKIYYPVNKYLHPYISVSAKTGGWVQGNVYLEKNISGEFGIRAYF